MGVREYWIVDPDHARLEVWTLAAGRLALMGTFTRDHVFVSPVLGGQVRLRGIFDPADA